MLDAEPFFWRSCLMWPHTQIKRGPPYRLGGVGIRILQAGSTRGNALRARPLRRASVGLNPAGGFGVER